MGFFRREDRKSDRLRHRGARCNGRYCEEDYDFEPRLRRYGGRDILDPRRLAALTIHPDNPDDQGHYRSRRTPVDYNHQPAQPSFGRAMIKLFKQLTAAERFYREFQTSFDDDIAAIKQYTTVEIKNTLWILKVEGGNRHRKHSPADHDVDSTDDTFSDRPSERFESIKTKVLRALDIAMSARPPPNQPRSSKRSNSKAGAAIRLYRKVQTASEEIEELLHQAPQKREYCKSLLGELEMLKALVDPETENNKTLYKKDGEEDEANGSEAGTDEEEANGNSGY